MIYSAKSYTFLLEKLEYITKRGAVVDEEAKEYINADKKKDLIWGIIGFILVLAVIGMISLQRSVGITDATGIDDKSLIQKIFPIIIVLFEMFTGIYLGQYLLPLWGQLNKKKRAWKKYKKHVSVCSHEDRLVRTLLEQANMNGFLNVSDTQSYGR